MTHKVIGGLNIDGELRGLVEQIDFTVASPSAGDEYTLVLHSTYPYDITDAWVVTESGTMTVDFYLDGTGIGGLTGASVSSTKSNISPTAGFSSGIGQELTCGVDAASSPVNFKCTLKTERT
jgi:hypothetical protein